MQNPKLSLIIAFTRSRDVNRHVAVDKLIKDIEAQTYRNFEVIAVEDLQGYKTIAFPHADKVDRVIAISDRHKRKFNKAWVMNVGAKEASTEHLLFIDAEISFGPDYLQKIVDFMPNKEFFNGWSTYYCEAGRDNPNRRVHCFGTTLHALVGCFYSTKDFFFNKLGGYCEDFFGYGGEDNEIYLRAEFIFKKIPFLKYELIHQYHHWHPIEGANPLNPLRFELLDLTKANPSKTIQKLIAASIGNKEPTSIWTL